MLISKARWDFLKEQNKPSEWENSSSRSAIMMDLLMQRGIATEKAAEQFLSPNLTELYSPNNLSMIDKASKRVHRAIAEEEKILVYGDYDADGVTSTTLLLKALQELGASCDYYIPNRFTEGYGPNKTALKKAYDNGFRLVITVDSGIASIDEAKLAKQLGLDLIITDHHEIQEQLPDAYAVINPKCSPEYLFRDLAGVGVTFKFAEYLLGYFPEHLLDLVAVGTIADLVPLVNENRILAFYGLRTLSTTTNIGLKALKKICKIDGNVSEEDVGFLIGPRINAVGRLKEASLAVQLLMTEKEQEAMEIAETVHSINQERKQIVNDIVKEAEQMVGNVDEQGVIFVAKEGWNEGVLGIVASRLVQKYDRPAFVLTMKQSQIKGSARSIPAFNIFSNCMEIRDLFTQFGGHSQAAGMTFPVENFERIQNKLNEFIKQQLVKEDFKQVIEINKTLDISDMNEELVTEINRLAPFGIANPKPLFHLKSIPIEVRQIGNLKRHLKFQFKNKESAVEGIGFDMGHLYHHITPHTSVSIVGELNINEWNGVKKAQIIMQDMEIKEWQLFDNRGRKDINILPFIAEGKQNLLLSNEDFKESVEIPSHVKKITYDTDIHVIEETDVLYICELPAELNKLQKIIKASRPVNIHACYYVKDSAYLTTFPSRDVFKWYYGFIIKRGKLDLKRELQYIMDIKGWTKDRIIFMSKVFLELDFVKIENGVIEINSYAEKADLQDSNLYQQWLNRAEVEKILYYSNYGQLKDWFKHCLESPNSAKEEVTYGL